MAEQQLKLLRQKLQLQQQQFQNYRDECKMLENFLEEQTQKKQLEIRKLQEDAINKEKAFKLLKIENSQLQAEIATLKSDLAKQSDSISLSSSQKIKQLQERISILMKESNKKIENSTADLTKIENLEQQKEHLNEQLVAKQQEIKKLEKSLLEFQRNADQQKQLEKQLSSLRMQIEDKNEQIESLTEKNNDMESKMAKFKQKLLESSPRKVKKTESTGRQLYDKQRDKWDEKLKKYEAKIERMERIIKELKQKLAESKVTISPQKNKEEIQIINNQVKIYTACIIVTKPYFISPFVDVSQQSKTIKFFKSSRLGCYEKSLGASKHKFDFLSHNSQAVIQEVSQKIMDFQEDFPHFVFIFGSKKTSKRSIMAGLISKLLEHLRQKIEKCTDGDMSAVFLQKSQEEQNSCQREEAFTNEQIFSLLVKLAKSPNVDAKKSGKLAGNKKGDMPLISYFCLRVNEFCFQVATSSYTSIPIRQKQLIATFYNNVLYSKLPDVLQTSYGQKYLILTLNPIVDLYEDCKNILSVTLSKMLFLQSGKGQEEKQLQSPRKELLNTMAKKKLEQYQKQIQQNSLKIKKIEDQCFYYKLKFDQLEERLKNLISTHHGQNSYLKKSPILLSYEKMLKFVHSVQGRSTQTQDNGNLALQLNELNFEEDISFDAI